MLDSLETPSVIVDPDQVERNIREMVESCAAFCIRHRPHIKWEM